MFHAIQLFYSLMNKTSVISDNLTTSNHFEEVMSQLDASEVLYRALSPEDAQSVTQPLNSSTLTP